MESYVTPRFSHDKLTDASDADLIDVFEDVWKTYVFSQVQKLLEDPNGALAAMSLLCSYFEAAWIYFTGENSDGKSQQYFVKGFTKVFRSSPSSPNVEDEIVAKAIYKHIRCALAHTGMVSYRVNYSTAGAKAFYLTYPKNADGTLDFSAPLASIVVNPVRFFEGARQHFEKYLSTLRSGTDQLASDAFRKAVTNLWGLSESVNIVGMTEDQYRGSP